MVDLHSILATHHSKGLEKETVNRDKSPKSKQPSVSEIPDLFFDEILVKNKLTRLEIMVLMYLYRKVYSKSNLYRVYGFSQILSHTEIAKNLNITMDDVYHSLRKLEELGFINTIRSGQYFVRKYFSEKNDEQYGHSYDNF